ncbi:MAG: glycosyltransferase family 4 protein [Herpetosiphonaceae bacterium]|nr:glycosyltransferase family 4 protein [Herpetosiphonaceae bacterium]
MPAKILFFTDSECPSGMGTVMLNQMQHLDSQRYIPHLVLPRKLKHSYFYQRVQALGIPAVLLTVCKEGRDFNALVAYLQAQAFDLVHIHAGVGWEGNWGTWAARRAGIPSIRTEHLPYVLTDPDERLEHRFVISKLARLVTVSESAYRSFIQHGVPHEKVRTVLNGINIPSSPSLAEVAAVWDRLALPSHTPLFVSIGRLEAQKGFDVLLFALPQVLAERPDACFVLVGEGCQSFQLKRLSRELGVDAAITWLDHCSYVPALLTAATAVLMPSRFEGLPLVALEALALGTPVIGTAVAGVIDIVEHEVTGLLSPPVDSPALAQSMLRLLRHATLRTWLGRAGPSLIRSRYTAQHMAAATMDLYDEVLGDYAVDRYPLPQHFAAEQRTGVTV